MPRILCLWFPNWPIQRIVQCRPELKGRPLVLVTEGPRGGQVAACSSAAVAAGIRPAMPLAEAQTLVCDVAIRRYESLTDRRALEKLAEACERFSPSVALEEGDEPESLLLDISDLEHLWGTEASLTQQVEKFFTRRGYRVRLAVAETVGLAWALTHFRFRISDCGLRIEEAQSEIRNPKSEIELPVESLRIDSDTAALLRQLGIETVDQLAALPREELAARFGDQLLRRLDQLAATGREVVEPHRALAPWEVRCDLDEPTADRQMLTHVLGQLVERIARQLAARDQGAVRIVCLLRCTDGGSVPLRVGLLQPSASARQLLELIDLHLERLVLQAEVNHVELRVAIAGRLGQRQGELFGDCWSSDPHQLALLVNRLSSRLGCEQVLRAQPRASAVPERAVRWVAAVERRKGKETRRRGDKEKRHPSRSPCLLVSPSPCPSPRPLLLYPRPRALEVMCIAPDGPPQFVWLQNRRQRITYFAGPERIETLWWRGPSLRRDYYRVAVESGSHLWIFCRLTDGRWFLHGAFQ
jgi:protein ImuB